MNWELTTSTALIAVFTVSVGERIRESTKEKSQKGLCEENTARARLNDSLDSLEEIDILMSIREDLKEF